MTCSAAVPQQLPLAAADALSALRWANTTVLSNEVAAAVGELKAQPGRELQVHGGGTLIRWLLDHHLVDDLTPLTVPMVIGQGTRLFPDAAPDTAPARVESRSTPRRGDDPVLPAHRAPAARNGHGRHEACDIDTSSERRYDRSDRRTLSRGDASDAAV
jgi:riboflavin biosynthesis pyrimidine reductase